MAEKDLPEVTLKRLLKGSICFDAAQHLAENPDELDSYLKEAWEHPDPGIFLNALAVIVKARGLSATAREAGMARSGLGKALSKTGNPRYATLKNLFGALGIEVNFQKRPPGENTSLHP